jgi:hypothetical protein
MKVVLEKLERAEIDPLTAKVMLDARKWFASKLWWPMWGDGAKADVEPELGPTYDLDRLDEGEHQLLAALLAKARVVEPGKALVSDYRVIEG